MRTHKNAFRFPPRKILVPVDLSESSLLAWREAQALARRFDAKVSGLFVHPWMYYAAGMGVPEPYLAPQTIQEALKSVRARLGSDADVSVVTGTVENMILSWSREQGFDLIVMGTHGRTGFERALNGSVAETVVRHSTIPVLVARGPIGAGSVLAPVNFEPYSMEGLAAAARAAEALRARLTVLHVVSSPIYGGDPAAVKGPKALLAQAVEELPEHVRRACRPRMALAFGDPAEQIVSAARDADLVVLVAHRKGFLADIALGTTAERVLRHSHRSVLAIPSGVAAPRTRRSSGHVRRREPLHSR